MKEPFFEKRSRKITLYPSISIVVCTYNGREIVKRLLDSIFSQDYHGKLEVICVDGGSSDGTLELLKDYRVIIHHNKKKYPEGRGMGKDQGVKLAKHELILIVDQDNKLIGNDCLKNLVLPLMKDKEIFGVACRLYVDKNDNLTNRYLSYVGTDPFAANKSLEGRMALGKINLKNEEGYCSYVIKEEENLCTGGNCFVYRKSALDAVDGYTQDVDVINALLKKGVNKMAVAKGAYTHHLAINGFGEFLRKKWKWGWHYAFENKENRNVSWYPKGFKGHLGFAAYVLCNLIILPNVFIGVKQAIKYRDSCWLLHPIAMFCNTLIYCLIGFIRIFRR